MNNNPQSTSSDNEVPARKAILSQNWQAIQHKTAMDKTRQGSLIQAFIGLLEENFRAQHSPVFYAESLNITKSYLRKTCNLVVGVSTAECISIRLSLEACKLLEDPTFTIAEIGHQLGFDNPNYFYRFFKKRLGMTAKAHRNGLT